MSKKKSTVPFTMAQLQVLKEEGKIKDYLVPVQGQGVPCETKKRKSKFGNKTTEVDGIKFDSNREAKRYRELLLMMKAGLIGHLKLQVPYELNAGGTHSVVYVADFVYIDAVTGETVVEDSKGFQTVIYKKKRKLMKKIFGITIKET